MSGSIHNYIAVGHDVTLEGSEVTSFDGCRVESWRRSTTGSQGRPEPRVQKGVGEVSARRLTR
jgi:hypothetical protein